MGQILNQLPKGWVIKKDANAPKGFFWASNGKSIFSKDYEHALIRSDYAENN